jgi:DNA polymerase IV
VSAKPRAGEPRNKTIVHVDMDAFYVACEVRRDPSLKGKPVIVGGTGDRGVVAACSYEARMFGVHSAMPSVRAQRACPQAIVLRGDHALYAEVSKEVHAIFNDVTPYVEPLALDEAFLDVTGARRLLGDGRAIGTAIRKRVADELNLSCSVGVAPIKMVAKMASEAAKPKATNGGVKPGKGVVVVEPDGVLAFLHPHPVQALWGVGPKTLERLQRLGIDTIGDLAAIKLDALTSALGKSSALHLYDLANGRDDRDVEPDREAKSIGHEQTFTADLSSLADLDRELMGMAEAVATRLREAGMAGKTVNIKVRFGDFATITRAQSVASPVRTGPELLAVGRALLAAVDTAPGVRLLGISVSNLTEPPARQLSLLDEAASNGVAAEASAVDWDDATSTVDEIRKRFGRDAIGPARLITPDSAGRSRLSPRKPGEQQWGPDKPSP